MNAETKRMIYAVGLALAVLGGGGAAIGHAETPAASAVDVATLAENVKGLSEAVRDLRGELHELRAARERDLERALRGGDR